MKIREYANKVNHTIIGKLTRRPEWERDNNERCYIDEGGNEYTIAKNGVCITTNEGDVI